MDGKKVTSFGMSLIVLARRFIVVVLAGWTILYLYLTVDAYLYCAKHNTIWCEYDSGPVHFSLGVMTVGAWGVLALPWWFLWLARRKNAAMILVTIVCGCLLVAAAHQLNRQYTREVKNSNWALYGEWIVFHCTPSGLDAYSSLYIVRPDGSELTRLTTSKQNARSPSWSPDGEEIAFEVSGKLYKLKRGAKKLTPLPITDQPYGPEDYPTWSPDGQWIAFVSSSWKENTTTLFRVSADGGTLEPIISDVRREPIAWTSDGEWIIHSSSSRHIRKVRVDGSEAQGYVDDERETKQLPDFPEGALYPTWSPDEQWVVFRYTGMTNNGKLFKIKADGSEPQQLTNLDCDVGIPDWIRIPANK